MSQVFYEEQKRNQIISACPNAYQNSIGNTMGRKMRKFHLSATKRIIEHEVNQTNEMIRSEQKRNNVYIL